MVWGTIAYGSRSTLIVMRGTFTGQRYVDDILGPHCLKATPSLHVPTTNQVVPSPPRSAVPSGTINNYDMGWRLALRAICPATDSNSLRKFNAVRIELILGVHKALGEAKNSMFQEDTVFSQAKCFQWDNDTDIKRFTSWQVASLAN
ncbi:hypothetical protein TNCV_4225841 [Trichonephila clavipes]|uniref:Uncharacterized protein n=1 Tax=Trichonephila clavipes TaxID=2585209 RepID=A0A8X6VS67_TRICX|nr:hypothetical protein TNCV_4225841 [Trichonephila clavipes]